MDLITYFLEETLELVLIETNSFIVFSGLAIRGVKVILSFLDAMIGLDVMMIER
jgi:hypothetical protein